MVFPNLKGLVIILFFYICCGAFVFSIQVLNIEGGGLNECGDLFPKTYLLHKNSLVNI
jgi:hypothetical protein